MRDGEPVLEMVGVCASIGEKQVLRDVSLRLTGGRAYALLGPNGSGKTTLMRTALGLMPASAGEVRLFGSRPPAPPAAVGASFGPRLVHPGRKVSAELRFRTGLAAAGLPAREPVLQPLMRLRCGDLSTGQAQLLAFACALAAAPRFLVLDEPTSGLDVAAMRWVRGRLDRYVAAGGCALVASHDWHEVARWAPHFIVLRAGQVEYDGPGYEVAEPAGRAVRVRSCEPRSLQAALELGDLRYRVRAGGDVIVAGVSPEHLGRLLAAHGVPVTFMASQEDRPDPAPGDQVLLEALGT